MRGEYEAIGIHAGAWYLKHTSRRLVFSSVSPTYCSYQDPSLCGDPAEGLQVSRSWPEENDGEFHWYAYPRTPFCHYVAFPLKGKREIQRGLPIVG